MDKVNNFWPMMQNWDMSTHEYSPEMGNKVEVETNCPPLLLMAILSKLDVSR